MNASLIDHRLLRNPGHHLAALLDEGVITTGGGAHIPTADGPRLRITNGKDLLIFDDGGPDPGNPAIPKVQPGQIFTAWVIAEAEEEEFGYFYLGFDAFSASGAGNTLDPNMINTYGPSYPHIPAGGPTLLTNRVRFPSNTLPTSRIGLDLGFGDGDGDLLVSSVGLVRGRVVPRGLVGSRPGRLRRRPARERTHA